MLSDHKRNEKIIYSINNRIYRTMQKKSDRVSSDRIPTKILKCGPNGEEKFGMISNKIKRIFL
jgi:hypothetical protein